MEKITITKDEFQEAMKKATEKTVGKITKEHPDSPLMAVLIPITGVIFASEVKDILFGEEDKDEKKDNSASTDGPIPPFMFGPLGGF